MKKLPTNAFFGENGGFFLEEIRLYFCLSLPRFERSTAALRPSSLKTSGREASGGDGRNRETRKTGVDASTLETPFDGDAFEGRRSFPFRLFASSFARTSLFPVRGKIGSREVKTNVGFKKLRLDGARSSVSFERKFETSEKGHP